MTIEERKKHIPCREFSFAGRRGGGVRIEKKASCAKKPLKLAGEMSSPNGLSGKGSSAPDRGSGATGGGKALQGISPSRHKGGPGGPMQFSFIWDIGGVAHT